MRKKIIVGILTLLLMAPMMMSQINPQTKAVDIPVMKQTQAKRGGQDLVRIICYVGGQGGMRHASVLIPEENALLCHSVFHQLIENMTRHPLGEQTQQLKKEFIGLLAQNNLIPAGIPQSRYTRLLNPLWVDALIKHHVGSTRVSSPVRSGVASAMICDMSSEGSGVLFPFIMLPRPRFVAVWSSPDGTTQVGKFLSIGGFTAKGQQFGTALGFWGIGVAFAFPEGNIYSFLGYSLFVTVNAAVIESYPPNQAPVITGTDPVDNEQNVPLTLSELSFTISDPEGDLMSYNVTTNPDIGSGSGDLKPGGTYIIPVHGLQDLTPYSWTIAVSDAQHTTEQTFRFTTQAVAPVVSNPLPVDGAKDVPIDLTQLQFTLKDYQGDAMEYTVQTQPNIGSDHKVGVHNGTYTVPINGLTYGAMYRWFVNVTDGSHWTLKVFSFETGYPSLFNPFEYGWHYRKQITINHTQVADDLTSFPVLISTIDPDLTKTQDDGGDILFMNGTGVAKRQYHEIESFNHTTGSLVAWVNISVVSSSQDTTFYLYYGNPTCINQQYPTKTWNSHYKAVWHLNNNPTGTIVDSTINNNNGTCHGGMTMSELVDGKIGKCLNFDGVDDYVSVPGSGSLDPTDLTLIAWYQPHDAVPLGGEFLTKQCDDYWGNSAGRTYGLGVEIQGSFIRGYFETNTYAQHDEVGNQPVAINTWYYLALTFHKATQEGILYVNGSLNGVQNPCDSSVLWYNNPWDFNMGGDKDGPGGSHIADRFYHCGLDEIRILDTPLSSGWISTEYNNQNNPTGFLSIGPEVPGP